MTNKITEKIESLFWENTFSDVSMDDVASKLGMKKASLYYHFPSKEAMLIEVINYSYDKYRAYLIDLFEKDKIEEVVSGLITYSIKEKNLFSIISQKWYCKIEEIKNIIEQKNAELTYIFNTYFQEKYKLNKEKLILLQSTIWDLSKRSCLFDCKEMDIKKITNEIITLFFNNK